MPRPAPVRAPEGLGEQADPDRRHRILPGGGRGSSRSSTFTVSTEDVDFTLEGWPGPDDVTLDEWQTRAGDVRLAGHVAGYGTRCDRFLEDGDGLYPFATR